ncbi:MAG: hypothetical protein AB7E72_05785 [Lysobacterales bacterium]
MMNTVIGMVALVGFVCALAVHLGTFLTAGLQPDLSSVWPLHAGLFAVFIPMVFSLRKRFGKSPDQRQILSVLPRWAIRSIAVVFAYVVVNFAVFVYHTHNGSPGVRGDSFVIEEHGRVVQEISESQYLQLQAYVSRGFSGHWLLFYLVPALYFLAGRRDDKSA